MQPRFEGDISLFNFVVELVEIKALVKFFFRSYRHLRRLARAIYRAIYGRGKTPDLGFNASGTLSELHLTNEFAIKPLISDLMAITFQLNAKVLEMQEKFAEAGAEPNSRHYTEVIVNDHESDWSQYSQDKNIQFKYGTTKSMLFNATMEYSYIYSLRSTLDAITKYWGVIPTWEAIWNAIPGSFLVDYIFTVGRSIKAMSRDPNVELKLAQYCESLLSSHSRGYYLNNETLLGDGYCVVNGRWYRPHVPALVAGFESSLYTRRVTVPNKSTVLPSLKPMSSRQMLNTAAILRCFF